MDYPSIDNLCLPFYFHFSVFLCRFQKIYKTTLKYGAGKIPTSDWFPFYSFFCCIKAGCKNLGFGRKNEKHFRINRGFSIVIAKNLY